MGYIYGPKVSLLFEYRKLPNIHISANAILLIGTCGAILIPPA